MKLEIVAAREDLLVGITEVLAHGEPLQLSGGVEWSAPKCWFMLHFLHVLCELGQVPQAPVAVFHPSDGVRDVIYAMRLFQVISKMHETGRTVCAT